MSDNSGTNVQPRWIAPENAHSFRNTNVQPFGFRHCLADLDHFTLDNIIALAGRIPDYDGFKVWQNGAIRVEEGWVTRPADRLTLEDTLAGIEGNNSVVVLKHVEQDPVVGPVFRELLQEVFANSSKAFRDDVVIGECLVFVNSPGRISPYHFDLESSFLLQVRGEKMAYAWPCGDNGPLTPEELERYCTGNHNAGIYRAERQHEARSFRLLPGDGVHFPSTGPHWVQNSDAVSISINVNFDLRSLHHRLAHTYAFNHNLRRLGIEPQVPGRHPLIDDLKAGAWQAVRQTRRIARHVAGRSNPGDRYPVWQPER